MLGWEKNVGKNQLLKTYKAYFKRILQYEVLACRQQTKLNTKQFNLQSNDIKTMSSMLLKQIVWKALDSRLNRFVVRFVCWRRAKTSYCKMRLT